MTRLGRPEFRADTDNFGDHAVDLEPNGDGALGTEGHARAGSEVPAARLERQSEHVELLLVCSSGGHLLQLHSLRSAWSDISRAWVTFDKSDARSLLRGERTFRAYGPTNRSLVNLARNLWLAWRVLRRTRPRVVLSTGAGVAVPFAWIGRLRGAKVVYVESFTRVASVSLSYRLIRPVANRTYVQWPEMLSVVPRAHHAGNVFFDP